MSNSNNILARWKLYSEMTKLGDLARRYFVMNFFDGVLTVLGVIIAKFILFRNNFNTNSNLILILGFAVSIAIGISGITGGLLTERAERTKNILDLKRSMAMRMRNNIQEYSQLNTKIFEDKDYYPPVNLPESSDTINNEDKSEPVDVDPKIPESTPVLESTEKTISEKAENFAGIYASLINGFAPAGGGVIGLIPFLFIQQPDLITYLSSFILMAVVLFLLGVYLARISEDRIWKYSILMVMAGVITAFTSFILTS